jgi:Uma2 family endonuclease
LSFKTLPEPESFATLSLRKVSFGWGRRIRYLAGMAATIDQPTPSAKHWTWEDLQRFDETERFEIYDGELNSMAPAPDAFHQRLVGKLYSMVLSYLERAPVGEVFLSPLDVVFSDDNTAQPDLLFVANENAGIVRGRVFGAPDLAVEILSPSSIRRDRKDKLEQYARFGVKEYWIVDPANRSVEILALRDGRYVEHAKAVEKGNVSSLVLSGFTLEVAQIF